MAVLRNSITIKASPDAVWALLGDLARAPDYVPGIVTAHIDGTLRICTDANGNEIREAISEYSPDRRTYRFEHLQVPLPVQRSQGRFAIEADGAQSRVVLEWEVEARDPATESQLTAMIDGAAKMTLDNLRQRIEEPV